MSEPDGRVPRSYVTRPAPEVVPDEPVVPEPTPRELRLAHYRSTAPVLGGGAASAAGPVPPRRLLVAGTVLAGIPAALMLSATLSVLMTTLTLPLGLPEWWGRGSWNLVITTFTLGPWIAASCVAAVVLLLLELVRPLPRDAWGRTAARSRSSVTLMASTVGLVVLTPLLAVSGFMLFLASAYVCASSSATCW